MSKTKNHFQKSGVITITLLITLIGAAIFPTLVGGVTNESDWVIEIEDTSAMVGDTGHVIHFNGSWNGIITEYHVIWHYDPTAIEIVDVSLEGTPAKLYNWSIDWPGKMVEGDYILAVAKWTSLYSYIPKGSGVLFKLVVNIKDDAPTGDTLLELDTYEGFGMYFSRFYDDTGTMRRPELVDGTITIMESDENNPPNTPRNPIPSNHETNVDANADLGWTGGDPDPGDTVTYDVYFGSSSTPPLVRSSQASKSYDPGLLSYDTTYYWKVVASDDEEASTAGPIWTFTTESTSHPEPQLSISTPSKVNEGENFQVSVKSDGTQIEAAQLQFLNTPYYTDNNGQVTLLAPWVDKDTVYSITASKPGYQGATTTIKILNKVDLGWVQGVVMENLSNGTIPLADAMVCLIISDEDNVITSKCTFTDEQGAYTIEANAGTYTIKAGKKGYITSTVNNVAIKSNETTWINFTLERGTGTEPGVFPVIVEEYHEEILKAIADGKVGGELIIQREDDVYESQVVSYNDISIDPTNINEEQIKFIVDGDENAAGKTIVITVEDFALEQDIVVSYDGKPIDEADSIVDVLNPYDDGINAEYHKVQDPDGTKILVSVAHFSEHEITISALEKIVKPLTDVNAVLLYVVIAVIAALIFIGSGEITKRL